MILSCSCMYGSYSRIRTVIKNLLQIGANLSQSREFRDLFEDILTKVLQNYVLLVSFWSILNNNKMISYSGDSDILRLSSHLKKLTYQSKSWIALWFVVSPPLIGERAVFPLSLGHIRNIVGALFLLNFLSLCWHPYRQEPFTIRNVCMNECINFLSVSQVKALDLKQVYP